MPGNIIVLIFVCFVEWLSTIFINDFMLVVVVTMVIIEIWL